MIHGAMDGRRLKWNDERLKVKGKEKNWKEKKGQENGEEEEGGKEDE